MFKFDLLDETEGQVAYLDNACKALRLVTEDLDRVIHGWMKDPINYPMDWVLGYCSSYYVVLREIERIHDDLAAAVTKEYETRRE